MPEIAASPEAIRAASAAWQRARLHDDKLGEPDPARLAVWAESVERWKLNGADLIEGVNRYYEGLTSGRAIQTGDLLHHAREVRRQRSEREKAAEAHAAASLPVGDGWAGLPISSTGRPVRAAYELNDALNNVCQNCGATPGDSCTSANGKPQKVPCLSRLTGKAPTTKRKLPNTLRDAA